MPRSVLCSAVERTAASGVLRAAASRALSTSAPQAALKDPNNRQGRLAAAASAVGNLGNNNNNNNNNDAPTTAAPSPSTATATSSAAPFSGVKDARSLGAAAADGASSGGGEGKIINVRSLPRRGNVDFSTGTRFPGRFAGAGGRGAGAAGGGAAAARAPAAAGRTNTNPAFGATRGGGGGSGGAGRRPRRERGGSSSGGGGGVMLIKRAESGTRPSAEQLRVKLRERKQAAGTTQKRQMDDDELEWLETHAEDKATVYEPAATTEAGVAAGLKGHGPAVPWSRAQSPVAAAAGMTEAALRAMRVLAGGWAFSAGSTEVLGTEVARERLRLGQRTFFDSAAERAAVEAVLHGSRRAQQRRAQWAAAAETKDKAVPSLIAAPSAATRAAIVDAAVRGVYAAPTAAAGPVLAGTRAAFAEPEAVLASFARYHVQDHTYTAEHMRRFEERARGLLMRGR